MAMEQRNDVKSDNSEMQEFFADKREKKSIDWHTEYLKVRFSSAYFVFKIRRLWFFFDKISSILFVIISLIIMFLSNYWQISLAMLFYLGCFISLCMMIAKKFYEVRKNERKTYKVTQDNEEKQKDSFRKYLTVEEINMYWKRYKKEINEKQI